MAYTRSGGWAYPSFSYSRDLKTWSPAEPAKQITPGDVQAPAVECMIPFNYGNQDLGFPCGMDKPKGAFTVMLAARHDGGEWSWINHRENFIPHGPPSSYYATGAVPLHNEPFLVGDELLIYFNAFSRQQTQPSPFGNRTIGVAKLRRDGFAGLQSSERIESVVENGHLRDRIILTQVFGQFCFQFRDRVFGDFRIVIIGVQNLGFGESELHGETNRQRICKTLRLCWFLLGDAPLSSGRFFAFGHVFDLP